VKLKKILVTTDFSDLSREAFIPATGLARRFKAELHLVHVLEALPPVFFTSPQGAPAYSPEKDYHLRYKELLSRAALDPAFGELTVKPHLLEGGFVHDRVVEFQRHHAIDLTVLATHGRSGVGHFFLGSFAERVVRQSVSPVLVHPPRKNGPSASEFTPKSILVPYDFSENARAALGHARFFAENFGARVRLQNVVEPLPDVSILAMEGIALDDFNLDPERTSGEVRRRLEGVLKEELPPETAADVQVDLGHPAEEIVAQARQFRADLIVMATHGRTGLRHVLMGSVAEKVVRRAPCPVLTVRPETISPSTR